MPLEALIAEDEELLRQSLVQQLGRLWPDLRLVAECEDGASALEQLAEKQPDIAFLDIRMPGISGIEVARSLSELSPRTQVVFVTASAKGVLTAPLDALQGKPGSYQVRILGDDGQPGLRAVKVGARDRQVAEILEGLHEGERLVTGEAQAEAGMPRFQW